VELRNKCKPLTNPQSVEGHQYLDRLQAALDAKSDLRLQFIKVSCSGLGTLATGHNDEICLLVSRIYHVGRGLIMPQRYRFSF
jgi:hypothetical protein